MPKCTSIHDDSWKMLLLNYNRNLRFVHLLINGKDLAAEPRGARGWMQSGLFIPPCDAGKVDGLRLSHGCHFVCFGY